MNINDYIASGIIEQYVLGDVSTQEKKEVECMSHIYPEIAEAVLQLQQTLEGIAMQEAVAPPKELKQQIFKIIAQEATTLQNNQPAAKNCSSKRQQNIYPKL